MAQKGTQIVGQSCTVTKGTNKGKTGTYTRDDDGNIWCGGDWGGTECGTDRCNKDAKAQVRVFEYVDANGMLVQEVEGMGIFQYNAIIDVSTGEGWKISALPISSTSLTDLQKSGSKVVRRAAELLESHLRGQDGSGCGQDKY